MKRQCKITLVKDLVVTGYVIDGRYTELPVTLYFRVNSTQVIFYVLAKVCDIYFLYFRVVIKYTTNVQLYY